MPAPEVTPIVRGFPTAQYHSVQSSLPRELPKTNVGKVLRRELRDVALKATKHAA